MSANRTPSSSASSAAAASIPSAGAAVLLALLFDVVGCVLDGADVLGILVTDLRPELFLEAHDQFDQVKRVGAQVIDERRFGLDVFLVDTELLDHNLLQALICRVCHSGSLLCGGRF